MDWKGKSSSQICKSFFPFGVRCLWKDISKAFVNIIETELLTNTVMLFTSRRSLIHEYISACMWSTMTYIKPGNVSIYGAWLPGKYHISYVTICIENWRCFMTEISFKKNVSSASAWNIYNSHIKSRPKQVLMQPHKDLGSGAGCSRLCHPSLFPWFPVSLKLFVWFNSG